MLQAPVRGPLALAYRRGDVQTLQDEPLVLKRTTNKVPLVGKHGTSFQASLAPTFDRTFDWLTSGPAVWRRGFSLMLRPPADLPAPRWPGKKPQNRASRRSLRWRPAVGRLLAHRVPWRQLKLSLKMHDAASQLLPPVCTLPVASLPANSLATLLIVPSPCFRSRLFFGPTTKPHSPFLLIATTNSRQNRREILSTS